MKKFIAITLAIIMAISLVASLSACYISNPAKMSDLEGTYELTSFTRRPKDADSEDENATVDMIATNGIKAYLVVKSDGFGYYVYKDNDTELYADTIRITYTYDDENPEKIKEIRYDNGAAKKNAYPNSGEETLGLNFKRKKKLLTYYMPSSDLMKRDYSQSVQYTKVDGATDLSYASEQMGSTLSAVEFGLKKLDGMLYNFGGNYSEDKYIYFALIFADDFKTATVHYALKESCLDTVESNLAVSVSYDENNAIISVGNYVFKRFIQTNNYGYSNEYVFTTVGNNEYYTLSKFYPTEEQKDMTYEQVLNEMLNDYIEVKQQEEQMQ